MKTDHFVYRWPIHQIKKKSSILYIRNEIKFAIDISNFK